MERRKTSGAISSIVVIEEILTGVIELEKPWTRHGVGRPQEQAQRPSSPSKPSVGGKIAAAGRVRISGE
jgi:hypothetical protein